MEESCSSMERPLSYAVVAARADTAPAEADPGLETLGEAAPTAEERKEWAEEVLVFRPPPTPPPWSKFFFEPPQACAMYRVFCWKQRNPKRQMFRL
jgi:hypothetical protein